MVHYRRNRIAGGTYFFTVTLRDRQSAYLMRFIDNLRLAFRQTQHARPFQIDAIVVLPEHLHAIWTLPEGDDDYAGRWRMIKSHFTHALANLNAPITRNAKGEYDLWQRRYWEHTIRDALDFERHVDYIHYNPVKHGLVTQVTEWPHSSFHRYVREGKLPSDWLGTDAKDGRVGEIGEAASAINKRRHR